MIRHPRNGHVIDHLLAALSADGLDYRARGVWTWVGVCPFCHRRSLLIKLEGDDLLDDHDYVERSTLVMGCAHRCSSPEKILAYLMRPLPEIDHAREIRELQRKLAWAIDGWRRALVH